MTRRRSRTEVLIYRFDEGDSPLDISKDLLSCEWSRSMTADGSFTVTLVPESEDWLSIIPVGSWIRINQQCGPDMNMRTRLWGRVDQTAKTTRSAGEGAGRIRRHILSGRDHSSVLVDVAIEFAPYLTERLQARGVDSPPVPLLSRDVEDAFNVMLTEVINGTPDAFFRFIYDIFFLKAICGGQVFSLPASMASEALEMGVESIEKAADLLELVIGYRAESLSSPGMKGVGLDQTLVANQAGGRVWDLLKEWSNPVMNELFFRINPVTSRPQIVLRERPFPCYAIEEGGLPYLETQQWEKVEGVQIPETSFSNYSVGRNDYERINWFFLFAEGIGFSQEDQILLAGESYLRGAPIIDLDSAARYGLRRFERSTRYLGYDGPQSLVKWLIPATYWLTQMYSWYSLNHEYLSGTATVPYLERGDVGQRMWVKGEDGLYTEYYIEGISARWQKDAQGGTSASTDFILTRGVSGIVGELRRGAHSDFVDWNVSEEYPLPEKPPEDVQILLRSASQEELSWAEPEEVRTQYVNETHDSPEDVFHGPREYRDFTASELKQSSGEEVEVDDDDLDYTHDPEEGFYEASVAGQVVDQFLGLSYRDPGSEGEYLREGFASITPGTESESLADRMDRYQELLTANGVVAFDADELCYLNNRGAVERCSQEYSGWRYNGRDDRTRYAIPPESWWYHIIPPCLVFQEAVDATDGFVSYSDFRLYNGFRPRPYNTFAGGVGSSKHIYNHAIDVILRSSARGGIVDRENLQILSAKGITFQRALRSANNDSSSLFRQYRAYAIFYTETQRTSEAWYQTHIDAAFYGGVRAPDSSRYHDDSNTHGRRRSGTEVSLLRNR